MYPQGTWPWEGLSTLGTVISFLPIVSQFMPSHNEGSQIDSHKCVFWLHDRKKDFSHRGQSYNFTPLLVILCTLKVLDHEKDFPHWEQSYPFSPVGDLWCFFRSPYCEKEQPKNFSPVCDMWCVCSFFNVLTAFPNRHKGVPFLVAL